MHFDGACEDDKRKRAATDDICVKDKGGRTRQKTD